jgi:hypothetical protein
MAHPQKWHSVKSWVHQTALSSLAAAFGAGAPQQGMGKRVIRRLNFIIIYNRMMRQYIMMRIVIVIINDNNNSKAVIIRIVVIIVAIIVMILYKNNSDIRIMITLIVRNVYPDRWGSSEQDMFDLEVLKMCKEAHEFK